MSDQRVADNWAWFIGMGAVLALLGLMALGNLVVVTMAVVAFFGFLFLFGAVVHIVHAFYHTDWNGFLLELLLGVLLGVAGVFLVLEPEAGAKVYTLFLGISLIFKAGVQLGLAYVSRRFLGWLVMVLSGALSLLLGVLIIAKWPDSSFFVIGLFVGVDLLLSGASWIALGLTARQFRTPQGEGPTAAV